MPACVCVCVHILVLQIFIFQNKKLGKKKRHMWTLWDTAGMFVNLCICKHDRQDTAILIFWTGPKKWECTLIKMHVSGHFFIKKETKIQKLTTHPSMIKKWDIYNVEFYAAI